MIIYDKVSMYVCMNIPIHMYTVYAYVHQFFACLLFNDHCVITKTISVALLLHPGLGLALTEYDQWRSFCISVSVPLSICSRGAAHLFCYRHLANSGRNSMMLVIFNFLASEYDHSSPLPSRFTCPWLTHHYA